MMSGRGATACPSVTYQDYRQDWVKGAMIFT